MMSLFDDYPAGTVVVVCEGGQAWVSVIRIRNNSVAFVPALNAEELFVEAAAALPRGAGWGSPRGGGIVACPRSLAAKAVFPPDTERGWS